MDPQQSQQWDYLAHTLQGPSFSWGTWPCGLEISPGRCKILTLLLNPNWYGPLLCPSALWWNLGSLFIKWHCQNRPQPWNIPGYLQRVFHQDGNGHSFTHTTDTGTHLFLLIPRRDTSSGAPSSLGGQPLSPSVWEAAAPPCPEPITQLCIIPSEGAAPQQDSPNIAGCIIANLWRRCAPKLPCWSLPLPCT